MYKVWVLKGFKSKWATMLLGPLKSCQHLSKDNTITQGEMKSPNKALWIRV